jgi:hypothetical protein
MRAFSFLENQMPSLDVFNQNAFGVITMTDAINGLPFVPGRAGTVVDWNERGITTTTVMIEQVDGVLKLLNPTPRGGPGETKAKDKRTARSLVVPHYQHDDAITADEVQGVRAFGSETEVQSVQTLVNQRLAEAVSHVLDPTLEFQRLGALKGLILNADGSTLYNLFTEFGVTQEDEINFDLAAASPGSGVLRKACAGVVRLIADNLGGVGFTGVHALCGNAFFDALLAHKEVVESYKGTDMAKVLRDGYVLPSGNKIYGVFEFGGIIWENYRGKNGTTPMVDTDKCHIFPTGVPGLFKTVYAPADYVETVNTIGLPRYARQYLAPNGKRIEMESQSNPLSYCQRPKVLIKGKRTA